MTVIIINKLQYSYIPLKFLCYKVKQSGAQAKVQQKFTTWSPVNTAMGDVHAYTVLVCTSHQDQLNVVKWVPAKVRRCSAAGKLRQVWLIPLVN